MNGLGVLHGLINWAFFRAIFTSQSTVHSAPLLLHGTAEYVALILRKNSMGFPDSILQACHHFRMFFFSFMQVVSLFAPFAFLSLVQSFNKNLKPLPEYLLSQIHSPRQCSPCNKGSTASGDTPSSKNSNAGVVAVDYRI